MNTIHTSTNGHSTNIVCSGDCVEVNGESIPIPKGMRTSNITSANGRLYIDGYEFIAKEKRFKRTLAALWYMWF